MRLRLCCIAALVLLVLVSGCRGSAVDSEQVADGVAQPLLQDTIHNFGRVVAGSVVEWPFIVENTGTASLSLQVLPADCPCIQVRPSRLELAAGSRGRLRVAFDTSGLFGEELKRVVVKTNSPRETLILYVSAYVAWQENNN